MCKLICKFCEEEFEEEDLKFFDPVGDVCSFCFEELKSEYGLIDGYDEEIML